MGCISLNEVWYGYVWDGDDTVIMRLREVGRRKYKFLNRRRRWNIFKVQYSQSLGKVEKKEFKCFDVSFSLSL